MTEKPLGCPRELKIIRLGVNFGIYNCLGMNTFGCFVSLFIIAIGLKVFQQETYMSTSIEIVTIGILTTQVSVFLTNKTGK